MKLKKLLSGVTAAIMALSSVAIASFTSVSATDTIEPTTKGWYQTSGALESDQFKLIQDWSSDATGLPQLYQKKELYIAFNIKGVTSPFTAYMIFSNGADWQGWNPNENGNAPIKISEDGTYVVSWKGSSSVNSEKVQFLAVAFRTEDSSDKYAAAENGIKASLVGVYLTEPTSEDLAAGGSTAPGGDTPDPNPPATNVSIMLTDTNGTQLGTQTLDITKDGQYTISADGLNLTANGTGFLLSGKDAKSVLNESATVTLDEILVNGTKYDVPAAWIDAAPWGTGDGANNFDVCPWNPWWTNNSINLDKTITINSISIKFTLKNGFGTSSGDDKEKPDDNKTPVQPADSVIGRVYYASSDWSVQPNTLEKYGYKENGEPKQSGVELNITDNGEYTFNITSLETDYFRGDANGAVVFVIDFVDAYKTNPNLKAELLSITVPDYENGGTKEIKFDSSKLKFGNIEKETQNLRLEIYNEYGDTKLDSPIDLTDIYFLMGDTMTVKIKVSGYVKNAPSNNTTAKKPTVNTTKKTRSADQVKKDKAAAKNAMKKAKIKTVNAKSKAKKKINVSWKKVKKAKGYEVQVSTNKKFKKSKIVFKKLTTKKKLTIKNKKIKSKKTYYVRVRAYATYKDKNFKTQKMFSAWSKKVAKVKVK